MAVGSAKNSKFLWALAAFLTLGALTAFVKLEFLHLNYTTDYDSYIETAKLFAGVPAKVEPWRVLKPLAPLFAAWGASLTGDFKSGFFIQVVVFYLLLIPVSFFLFRNFFRNDFFKTVAATAIFIWSFPVIRYALGPFTEAGAWFFYALSLLLALLFLRQPSTRLVVLNSLVLAAGFLYKEYSFVSLLIANIAIIFSASQSRREKLKYLALLNGIFILINGLWQYAVYSAYRYTYFDWYIDGGLSVAPVSYTFKNIILSFVLVLAFAWVFVPFGFLKMRSEARDHRDLIFLVSLLTVPFICLLWGAAQPRLFYVIAPGSAILASLGLDSLIKAGWAKYVFIAALGLSGFLLHMLYVGW